MSDQQIKTRPGATALLPAGWPAPKGYVNGIKARGDLVFVAGQVGWDTDGRFASGFVPQVRKALENIVDVLAAAGAKPEHVVRFTWYVTDITEYRASLAALGAAYRDVMGRNFPTMTLVEVKSLAEPDARVEIEATAVVPD
jgi:enamine deaminase RidA (YjgF/YER057c/UK114 family)